MPRAFGLFGVLVGNAWRAACRLRSGIAGAVAVKALATERRPESAGRSVRLGDARCWIVRAARAARERCEAGLRTSLRCRAPAVSAGERPTVGMSWAAGHAR